MDKRIKKIDHAVERQARDQFFEAVQRGEMSFAEGVRQIRKLSKLTQPEFAKHRGISLGSLRQIESGTGNPQVETLNKIGEVFGLEAGFVTKRKRGEG
ncbi:transcriptional regulator [Methylobacillus rhizosphaerae]|uniref:Transcriptional regulator n=1 Tax=Methylobacillus rhizosphaerae TaxID=551994 RepID=A0A238ZLN6_9PROT|nr:helix-turn-helix transcriptional regulator [Methylobacillus rhizosphaerae]SNR84366.1 transcriptional regulator [Methylobacillus rhizosphaerae]